MDGWMLLIYLSKVDNVLYTIGNLGKGTLMRHSNLVVICSLTYVS